MPGLSSAKGPEVRPLEELARQLLSRAPPLVEGIISTLVPEEGFTEFVALVQEYVPEHMAEILAAQSPAAQIALFGNYFRDQYFPLAFDGDWVDPTLEYYDLLRQVPIPYGGVEYEDFHEVDAWRVGHLLMGSLYVPHRFDPWDEGVSQVWLEQCGTVLDRETLRRIPRGGLSAEELHRLLDGAEYECIALFALPPDRRRKLLAEWNRNHWLPGSPEYFLDFRRSRGVEIED